MNKSLVINDSKPKFKRCIVHLKPKFNGYGFYLNSNSQPKYSIFSVDPLSPAYAANLRTNDVIVEIDKKNIRRLNFDKIRQMLCETKQHGHVEILAISKEDYDYYKKKGVKLSNKNLVKPNNTESYSSLLFDDGSSKLIVF